MGIIATRSDVGAIRVLDQAKRYKPGHLVTAEEVRAMWGVLNRDMFSGNNRRRPKDGRKLDEPTLTVSGRDPLDGVV